MQITDPVFNIFFLSKHVFHTKRTCPAKTSDMYYTKKYGRIQVFPLKCKICKKTW